MNLSPVEILKKYWGFSSFRPLQEKVINAVLDQNDVLALMPTGGGKSICYQIPALAQEGLCIVISPLVALIEDQITQLKAKGIKAISLTGGISTSELEIRLNNAAYGNYKFLYLSPERLNQELVKNRLSQLNISLIAVDEAHCISEWGHDFRPAYLKIKEIRGLLPGTPIIATTATATTRTQQDIIKELQLEKHLFFQSSYIRKNLSYGVYPTQDKNYLLQQILQKQKGTTIVYVNTRRETESLSKQLSEKNIKALPYHGGLTRETKKKHYNLWYNNEYPVMIATNAFGMGIDKPDVRLVVHLHLPDSIEHYFQEAGRAGRDGKLAYAILIQTPNASQKLLRKFESQNPDIRYIKHIYRKLSSYLQVSYGEGIDHSYSVSFTDFCNRYQLQSTKTYNTLQLLDNHSVLRVTEVFNRTTEIQFLVNQQTLLNTVANQNQSAICNFLLRNYPGIFTYKTNIDTSLVASKTGLSQNEVASYLEKLAEREMISLKDKNNDLEITYLQPREDDSTINRISKYLKIHLQYKRKKLESMIDFVTKEKECKSKYLLSYFGEETADCGICSACVKNKKREANTTVDVEKVLLSILQEKALDSRNLIAKLPIFESAIILDGLRNLLEKNIIDIQNDNTYSLKNKS